MDRSEPTDDCVLDDSRAFRASSRAFAFWTDSSICTSSPDAPRRRSALLDVRVGSLLGLSEPDPSSCCGVVGAGSPSRSAANETCR